jgi:hypothetical protein
MGFNIASFGPLAGGMIAVLIAATAYLGLRHMRLTTRE